MRTRTKAQQHDRQVWAEGARGTQHRVRHFAWQLQTSRAKIRWALPNFSCRVVLDHAVLGQFHNTNPTAPIARRTQNSSLAKSRSTELSYRPKVVSSNNISAPLVRHTAQVDCFHNENHLVWMASIS
jgi:hypothetical protein